MRDEVWARGEGEVEINVDRIDGESDIGRKQVMSDKAMGTVPIMM